MFGELRNAMSFQHAYPIVDLALGYEKVCEGYHF